MFTFWAGLIVGVLLGSGLCIGAFAWLLLGAAAEFNRDMAGD